MAFYSLSESIVIDDDVELRILTVGDAGDLFRLIDTNRMYLARHLSWVDKVDSVTATEDFIRVRIDDPELNSAWYKLYVDGQLSGLFGVKSIIDGCAELGYFIAENKQGRGVIARCLTYSAKSLDREKVNRIALKCLPENSASISVAERFGAQFECYESINQTANDAAARLNVYIRYLS